MNRRKVLTCLLGASFVASLTSKTFRRKKGAVSPPKSNQLFSFVGTWSFVEPTHFCSKRMIIDEEDRLFIDEKLLLGSITSLNQNKFVFMDHLGYELIFRMQEDNQLYLYDSADDKEYQLILQTPEEQQEK